MLDFLLTVSPPQREARSHTSAVSTTQTEPGALSALRPYATHESLTWACADGRVQLVVWHTAVPPFNTLSENVRVAGGRVDLFIGHASMRGQPMRSVDAWIAAGRPEDDSLVGDYLAMSIAVDGWGRLTRPPVTMWQLYRAGDGGGTYISTRMAICARAAGKCLSSISVDWLRWAASNEVAASEAAMVSGVDCLRMDRRLDFTGDGLRLTRWPMSRYFNPSLHDAYLHNRQAYWDETFDTLCEQAKVIGLTDDPISFPLSGGKDSRLLLGILARTQGLSRLQRVYTNGPTVSPEVQSARAVCAALGISHFNVDTTTLVAPKPIVVKQHLPVHLCITEGEMSPENLTFRRGVSGSTQLNGQEGGLRNIAGRADLPDVARALGWFKSHFHGGDKSGILASGMAVQSMAELEAFVRECCDAGVPPSETPSLHRVFFRLSRWVGRTWRVYNSIQFAPYLFTSTEIVTRTLSSGSRSRSNEEFHYEMLRRLDARLVRLPFANQTWHSEVWNGEEDGAPPEPLTWPGTAAPHLVRPMFQVTVERWPQMLEFIERHSHPLVPVLDFGRMRTLDILKVNPVQYHNLWQTFQAAMAGSDPDWSNAGRHGALLASLPDLDIPVLR